jgi:hypothetical protein
MDSGAQAERHQQRCPRVLSAPITLLDNGRHGHANKQKGMQQAASKANCTSGSGVESGCSHTARGVFCGSNGSIPFKFDTKNVPDALGVLVDVAAEAVARVARAVDRRADQTVQLTAQHLPRSTETRKKKRQKTSATGAAGKETKSNA